MQIVNFKQTETIEQVKKNSVFLGECKLYGWIPWEFIALRMRNFHSILFMSIRTYREILVIALVYLQLV